ncbi:MAG: hypothetical protein LBS64_05700 [Spirochaetaceae bacterium]|jgi:hypothetical protein|nr:hypothetical protein [Spirochaetaceae bacterium]
MSQNRKGRGHYRNHRRDIGQREGQPEGVPLPEQRLEQRAPGRFSGQNKLQQHLPPGRPAQGHVSQQQRIRAQERAARAAAVHERTLRRGEIAVWLQQFTAENREAIRMFKQAVHTCPRCGQAIQDIPSAFTDRNSGEPIHFECAMEILQQEERCREGEKIIYIGQGKFALVYFENPEDPRHFSIRREITWERSEQRIPWRTEIAGLFSQV